MMNRVFNLMLVQRQIHNLAIVGFMGTGKSSVGRMVADTLHFTFLDTDDVIEARAVFRFGRFSRSMGNRFFATGSGGSWTSWRGATKLSFRPVAVCRRMITIS